MAGGTEEMELAAVLIAEGSTHHEPSATTAEGAAVAAADAGAAATAAAVGKDEVGGSGEQQQETLRLVVNGFKKVGSIDQFDSIYWGVPAHPCPRALIFLDSLGNTYTPADPLSVPIPISPGPQTSS